jgi:hypothetical protein
MNTKTENTRPLRSYRPGFLLSPLGWLAERLSNSLAQEPDLPSLLFELEPHGMHMLGIAIAHGCDESVLATLFRQAPRALVEQAIGYWPEGLERLVQVLSAVALSPAEYRAVPILLRDPAIAKFLQHQREINGSMITGLSALPLSLRRPPIFKLFGRLEGMDRFVEGLTFLSVRGGRALTEIEKELALLDQVEQVTAKIAHLVDCLPLPVSSPPPSVGPFCRIDAPAEIRTLAKAWHNCLADYVYSVDEGTAAVYLSNRTSAVAFVSRFGRLGWLLVQIKGPGNIDIEPIFLTGHQKAFYEVGIPLSTQVAAIRDLILQARWPAS